jgi:hypothetical protein
VIQKLQELGSPGPRWAVPQKKMTGLNYRPLEENKRVEVGGRGGGLYTNTTQIMYTSPKNIPWIKITTIIV